MNHAIPGRRLAAACICLALTAGPAPGARAEGMTLLEQVDTVRAPAGDFTFTAAITDPDGDR